MLGDRPTLVRAVVNLLLNAWKYTGDDKRIGIAAQAVAKHGGDHRASTTASASPGTSAARSSRAFAGAKRPSGGARPASGWAWRSCGLIARAHKGTIDVAPAAGGGSAFRLRLPAARVPA